MDERMSYAWLPGKTGKSSVRVAGRRPRSLYPTAPVVYRLRLN